MRETMFVRVAGKLLTTTLIALALSGAFGCGDDDEGSGDAGPTTRAGRGGGGGGSGGTAGDAPIVPLPDKTAGKGCKADKDCGTGTCLQVVMGSFGGGLMEAPGGYCSTTCMANTDCGEGGTCSGAFAGIGGIGATAGRCLKSCASSSDCREGYRCVNGLGMTVMMTTGDAGMQDPTGGLFGGNGCEPLPATTELADGVVGSPCVEATDCGSGRCEKGTAAMPYPDGYCTGACLETVDCGAQGSCTLPFGGGAGTCYLSCAADSDCREGYRCRANGSLMQCVPGAAPLPDGVVGNACTANAECGGAAMSCVGQLGNITAPDGYCSLACIDGTDCGSGGSCVGGLGAALAGLLGPTGVCYKTCADASDCREGYTCGTAAGGFGGMSTQTVCTVTPPPPPPTDDAGVE